MAKSKAMCVHFAHKPGRFLWGFREAVHLTFFQNPNLSCRTVLFSDRSGILSGQPQNCRNMDRYFWGCATTTRGIKFSGLTATPDSAEATTAGLEVSLIGSPACHHQGGGVNVGVCVRGSEEGE